MNAAYANMEMPKPPLPALFGFISALARSASHKKNQSPYPRWTTREGQPDGGMFWDYNASSVGTLMPSTIFLFWASDIPAEYRP